MPTRSESVADAAITVLARDGLRGLTHRAVDEAAGLAQGSTSNCFRSRAALIGAAVARLEELDLAALTAGEAPDPNSIPDVARYLAQNVERMTARRQVRATRARIALLLDDVAAPAMEHGHERLMEELRGVLAAGGHRNPDAAARSVADLLEGALIHAVTVRSRTIDVPDLAATIERLLA